MRMSKGIRKQNPLAVLAEALWEVLTYIERQSGEEAYDDLLELHDSVKPRVEYILRRFADRRALESWQEVSDEAVTSNTAGPAEPNSATSRPSRKSKGRA